MRKVWKQLDVPPVWFVASLGLMNLLKWAIPEPRMNFGNARISGIIMIVFGFVLIVWAVRTIVKAKTPIEPRRRPKTLVRTGPFKFSRNPIYTGMLLVLLGFAWSSQTVSALLAPLFFFFLIKYRFILGEETRLREEFGQEAEDYFANTRRW